MLSATNRCKLSIKLSMKFKTTGEVSSVMAFSKENGNTIIFHTDTGKRIA